MKNSNTKILVGLVAVLIIAIGSYFVPTGSVERIITERVTDNRNLGATPGSEFWTRASFNQGFVSGGIVSTTTTKTTHTTESADFRGTPTVISWLPNINQTITLSGTSTQVLIPNVGDVAEIYFRNASTTAAATVTFAAVDAGLDLQRVEATGGDLVLEGKDWARLTFIKTATHLVTVIFDEMQEGD